MRARVQEELKEESGTSGMLRTLRSCLEARFGKRIPVNHPLIAWMVEHSALMRTVRVKGKDGVTPWFRARGRPFGQRLIGFGESIWWKFPGKGPQHDPHGNAGDRWGKGIFVGIAQSVGQ